MDSRISSMATLACVIFLNLNMLTDTRLLFNIVPNMNTVFQSWLFFFLLHFKIFENLITKSVYLLKINNTINMKILILIYILICIYYL